jgi:hypothetical protein
MLCDGTKELVDRKIPEAGRHDYLVKQPGHGDKKTDAQDQYDSQTTEYGPAEFFQVVPKSHFLHKKKEFWIIPFCRWCPC